MKWRVKWKLTRREALTGGLALVATIALCVAAVYYRDFLLNIAQFGYLGCFIINIFAGSIIFVPVPGLLVIFTLGGVLNPAIVGAVGGLGEAIGSVLVYLTGYAGRGAVQNIDNTLYKRFSDMFQRHGSKIVFAMAAIFNPVYYFFGLFVGMIRFGLTRFFLLTWAGRTVKNMIVAYLGYFGLRAVLQWLGVAI